MLLETPNLLAYCQCAVASAVVLAVQPAIAQPEADPNLAGEATDPAEDDPGEEASDTRSPASENEASVETARADVAEAEADDAPAREPRPPASAEPESARGEPASDTTSRQSGQPAPDQTAVDPGPPTLLGPGKVTLGGYGGVAVRYTRVAQTNGLLVGGEGALLIGHAVAIGGAGYGLVTIVHGPDTADGIPTRLHFGYGGPVLRFNFMATGPVYVAVGALIGAGGFALVEEPSGTEVEPDEEDAEGNGFFVAEPQVSLHANVTRFMRLGLHAAYRFTHGVSLRGYRDADFRGPVAGFHLQFGWL